MFAGCSYFQLGLPVLYCIPWICTIQSICKFGCSLAFKQIPNPLSWKQEKLVVNLWEREINRQTVRLVTSSLGRIGGTDIEGSKNNVAMNSWLSRSRLPHLRSASGKYWDKYLLRPKRSCDRVEPTVGKLWKLKKTFPDFRIVKPHLDQNYNPESRPFTPPPPSLWH